MKQIKNAVKGKQLDGIHGSFCMKCGHYDEVHFRNTDCDCDCHND